MNGARETHTSLDLHLCSAGWHLCALVSKVPHFSELPLLAYTEGSWCLSPRCSWRINDPTCQGAGPAISESCCHGRRAR